MSELLSERQKKERKEERKKETKCLNYFTAWGRENLAKGEKNT